MQNKKKILITSALPYANGPIHLGHLVEHVQTDIFVRFQKLIGNTCYYICADDAHGTAIMLSAEKENKSPEDYIAEIKKQHEKDFKNFYISKDILVSNSHVLFNENKRCSKILAYDPYESKFEKLEYFDIKFLPKFEDVLIVKGKYKKED